MAYNGLEALSILAGGRVIPDIIILDINMPMMDGLTTLKRIRANEVYKNIPIIIFSMTEDPKTISDAYRLGASLYLCKPAQYEDYLLIMGALLTGADISTAKLGLFVRRS